VVWSPSPDVVHRCTKIQPSANNPFAAKNKIYIFVVDDSVSIFENYLVAINIWPTKIVMTKMPLDILLTDIFHVVACYREILQVLNK